MLKTTRFLFKQSLGSPRLFHASAFSGGKKVVATLPLLSQSQKRLEEQGFDLVQWPKDGFMPRDVLLKEIKGAEGLICRLCDKIDKDLMEAAGPQLKVVSTMSVGYDHIDLKTAREKNIKIGYTPDVLTDATADLTVMLTLAAARNMKAGIRACEEGEWKEWRAKWLCGHQFRGKTLGVVGMGRIGQGVAERLKAFGIERVVYWGRTEKPGLKDSLNADFVSFDELAQESDFIVACCALTPDTKEMFNYDAFKKMKKSAIFVNTARGGVVHQDDLVRALEESLIAGAGLDVTTPEPLPTEHRLYQLDNCVILPHIGSATFEARETMGDMCIDNVSAALNNKDLPFQLKN